MFPARRFWQAKDSRRTCNARRVERSKAQPLPRNSPQCDRLAGHCKLAAGTGSRHSAPRRFRHAPDLRNRQSLPMIALDNLPRYDIRQSYDWNYQHAPDPVLVDVPGLPGTWQFCGLPVASPLGVPAGPLLNGRWVLYYASLGFDVLTYKTVRSRERACYPLPNLVPVDCEQLWDAQRVVPARESMTGSWAVSFGMPSKAPAVWRADVEHTRRQLAESKVLVVSVVATEQPGWILDDIAQDYAQCARWAVESGADCVETNFSCPNVATCDGSLYQDPHGSAVVAACVREAIGRTPYIIKVGRLSQAEDAAALVDAVAPYANALAMTNSIAAHVSLPASDSAKSPAPARLYFEGQPRGICGAATLSASVSQVELFAQIVRQRSRALSLIGVGGAATAEHVKRYLTAGAESVHAATAAMVDPALALRLRREW